MSKTLSPKDPTDQMIADLRDGMDGQFWQTVKKITQANIDDAQHDINNANEDGLSDQKLRNLIDWRNFLEHFVTLPEQIIQSLEQGNTEPVDFDPYASVKSKLQG